MTQYRTRVIGTGSCVPDNVVTNEDLSKKIDTTDEWITERTGIKQRHVVGEGVFTSHISTAAAEEAMENAGVTADDLDFIIVGTTTPDQSFPAVATTIQKNLGMKHGFAFDLQAACSGFLYAMATADSFLKSGQHKTGLIIGAEALSKLIDWEDRETCVLFGDGAGAFVLQATELKDPANDPGILSTHLHSDGRFNSLLCSDGGPSSTQSLGKLRMNGKEVFKHAVVRLSEAVEEAIAANGVTQDDIDLLVPHQANKRIIDMVGKKLGLNEDQVVVTIDKHANTSAASIPLAFHEAIKANRVKEGQLILMEAMGGGFTWGSSLIRW